MNEHESEPVRGLPEYLPDGEFIVWQGEPSWRQLALRVFHVRKIAVYFVLLAGLHVGLQVSDGASWLMAAKEAAWLVMLGGAALLVLGALARLYAHTTIYTITNRRVAMRIGAALTMTLNLPYTWIGTAKLDLKPSGHGTLAFELIGDSRVSYLMTWPHVRPWHMSRTQPALRCIPDAEKVARIFADAAETRISQPRVSRIPERDGSNAVAAE